MESIPHGYVCSRSIAWITTKFYAMDSVGYIYYQRVYRDGYLDPEIVIYRDAKNGPCKICLFQDDAWKERVIYEGIVNISK